MSYVAFPTESITSEALYHMILDGTDFSIVDVRNRDAFAAWNIEGRVPIRTINVPYFEIIEAAESEDLAAAAAAYATAHWQDKLPKNRPVVIVCAQEDTSAFVAEGLQRLGYEAAFLAGGMAAWGDYYAIRPITESDRLAIWQIARPARGCLSYVVASNGEAVLIDPLRHTEVYTDFAAAHGLTITAVFDTHGHADHISGGPPLADELQVPYYLHPYDAIHPLDVVPAELDYEPIRDGATYSVGDVTFQALHVPGHTLGNTVFLFDESYLLSGDTIFVESVARPDLGGQGERWAPIHFRSLERLVHLSPDVCVLPGHFSDLKEADATGTVSGRLGDLFQSNDDLRRLSAGESSFVQHLLGHLPNFPPQYIDIKRVNAGLLSPTAAEASELELGRNICALVDAPNNA